MPIDGSRGTLRALDDLCGHRIPSAIAKQPADWSDERAPSIDAGSPVRQAFLELLRVVGIVDEEILKRRGVMFRDASRPADEGGNTAAQRFMNGQAVRFVTRRMHQRVKGGQHIRNVLAKSQETNPIREPGIACALLPGRELAASADDDQVGVPAGFRAERLPRGKERVERLAAVAEGSDKSDEWPIGRTNERALRGDSLRVADNAKARGVASVIHDAHAVLRDLEPIDHVAPRALAVADHHSCGLQRLALGLQIVTVRHRGTHSAPRRTGDARLIRCVQVMHPVGGRNEAVAAVDDGPSTAGADAAPQPRSLARQQRTAEQMTIEWTPDAMHGDRREIDEIGPRTVRDEMDFAFACAQISGKRVVRGIHAAKRREITCDEQPGSCQRRRRPIIAPCSAPSRNQNCKPTCVANGTKLKTSAIVPRLTAATVAAHRRSSRLSRLSVSFHSYRAVTTKAMP